MVFSLQSVTTVATSLTETEPFSFIKSRIFWRYSPPPVLPLIKGEVPKPARPAGGAEGVIPPLIRGRMVGGQYHQKILDFIKEKGSVSVKDVATIITDCSEKTIQRELASLVNQGLLHRIGQKRWARYLLVSF